ncbi:helix-turn-helix domain-containing protein, partial [Coprobacillus sp. AM23-9LB]
MNKDYMYFYTKVSSANVTPSGRMVYRALLRYANRKTWSCFPSVKTIVNDTGL